MYYNLLLQRQSTETIRQHNRPIRKSSNMAWVSSGNKKLSQRRILYDHYLPTVILIIIGILSPTHSFTQGLNASFSANPPYRSLSFFSFRIHYMDFPDCLLLLLSKSVFLYFLVFFCFYTFLVVGSVRQIKLTYVGFRAHIKIASRIVLYRIVSYRKEASMPIRPLV